MIFFFFFFDISTQEEGEIRTSNFGFIRRGPQLSLDEFTIQMIPSNPN
jgi:hypothetical protein